MDTPLLLLSLLLLLLLLPTPHLALSQQCTQADLEILDIEVDNQQPPWNETAKDTDTRTQETSLQLESKILQPVLGIDYEEDDFIAQETYLQPTSSFLGISVETEEAKIFLPIPSRCFRGNETRWWQLRVEVQYFATTSYFSCIMFVGECNWMCGKNVGQMDVKDVRVLSHGGSRWRSDKPSSSCGVQDYWSRSKESVKCGDPKVRHDYSRNITATSDITTSDITMSDITTSSNITTTSNITTSDTTTSNTATSDITTTSDITSSDIITTDINTTSDITTTNTTINDNTLTTITSHYSAPRLGVVMMMVSVPLVVVIVMIVREKLKRGAALSVPVMA